MANPILVEVLRGGAVESAHRGAIVVCDADGGIVFAHGDASRPVYPRSAVKAIQALALVESGAADRFGFGDRELALACASHKGEPGHVELAAAMLARAGLDDGALECGAHWPSSHAATLALAASGGTALSLHNNCSGKHSGFLCTCVHEGIDIAGYSRRGHVYQDLLAATLGEVTSTAIGEAECGVDGCSIPTYAVPLGDLAHGFARMATGRGLPPMRALAAQRLLAACMAEPWYVSGTGGFDTALMRAAPGRIFAKTGAEGVYCAALPELGLGIAVKADDGASRAAEVMVAATFATLLVRDEALSAQLSALARPTLTNWNGIEVGSLRPASPLS